MLGTYEIPRSDWMTTFGMQGTVCMGGRMVKNVVEHALSDFGLVMGHGGGFEVS
jgi:hypothetical protein